MHRSLSELVRRRYHYRISSNITGMDHYINPGKTALTFGAFVGALHLVWSLFVAFGWAQPLADFVSWAHMISATFIVDEFTITAALTLVILSSIVGYVAGYFFARVWNWAHRG
jgi:hypothetical protein